MIPQQGKTRISIFIDNAVLQGFRVEAEKRGTGYQTMMNEALRSYLAESNQPLTKAELLRVIRQDRSLNYVFDVDTSLTYSLVVYTVIETPTFTRLWPDYWTEDERGEFVAWLAVNSRGR